MKLLQCTSCRHRVFFENSGCQNCGARLGFSPDEMDMVAFSSSDPWVRIGSEGPATRPCGNYLLEGICNWTVADSDSNSLCLSCRTTSIIPALNKPENRMHWLRLEQAKRRLFYTLHLLGLPTPDRGADPVHGLSFQFLEEASSLPKVLTGHDEGLITLNIAEADDAKREAIRSAMREPYRSLLGHFRHESGHYYWDMLVRDTPWLDEYRTVFGDERADYAEALKQHYESPLVDWQTNFVSAYASSHPWEDWAECWAHYLHMVDGLETAAAWGLQLNQALPDAPPVMVQALSRHQEATEAVIVEQWLPVAQFSNAMNRSLGVHDSYPFVITAPVVQKLKFIHRIVGAGAGAGAGASA